MSSDLCSSLSCTELTDSLNLEDFNISREKNFIVFFIVENVSSLRLYYVISLNGDPQSYIAKARIKSVIEKKGLSTTH